jgi:uncharacterized protein with FMN-binding domain
MKKIALSLLVVAASGAYIWSHAQQPAIDPLSASLLGGAAQQIDAPAVATALPPPDKDPVPANALSQLALPATRNEQPAADTTTQPVAVQPLPHPRPTFRLEPAILTNAAMTIAAHAGFVDGTYTGPATDAYYGLVQIQAVVQGGKLIGIKVLQYPSDRRTSVAINRQALPMLRDEAVSAQSANVNIITGATLTSQAFIRSLGGALRQAN